MSKWLARLGCYAQLIRLDRPIGIYLLLWPTLWGLWFAAEGFPGWMLLIIFGLGVFLMRSAGCAINDYADRDIDPHVERTKQRPLAAGKITEKEALTIFGVLCLIAFFLVLQLNSVTWLLSIPAVLLAASYPFMKRFHSLPQAHLGIAFAWSVPMAFTAIYGDFPPIEAWLLFAATVIWTVAYDTMYAMSDREDDLKIGVKSSAILFGRYDKLIIGFLQLGVIVLLIAAGLKMQMHWVYYGGLLVATGFFIYQQVLIRDREPTSCLNAFLNNNWVGLSIFVSIFLNYIII